MSICTLTICTGCTGSLRKQPNINPLKNPSFKGLKWPCVKTQNVKLHRWCTNRSIKIVHAHENDPTKKPGIYTYKKRIKIAKLTEATLPGRKKKNRVIKHSEAQTESWKTTKSHRQTAWYQREGIPPKHTDNGRNSGKRHQTPGSTPSAPQRQCG